MRADAAAVFVSDLHLWHKPPACRAGEPDWYGAMERQLTKVRDLRARLAGAAGVDVPEKIPVVYPGDVFDRPNPPPELISFAIRHLPKGYAVAGQHDLPYHSYEDIRKSAYWTLVEAGVITHLDAEEPLGVGCLRLHGFSWGQFDRPRIGLKPLPPSLALDVAVIHAYVWCKNHTYPDAPQTGHFKQWGDKLTGFDAAFFGDNHRGFLRGYRGLKVCNCGAFMRRRTDEADYEPCASVLYANGDVERIPLGTEGEVLDLGGEPRLKDKDKANFEVFLHSLQELQGGSRDYRDALVRYIDARGLGPGARRLVLAALEEGL